MANGILKTLSIGLWAIGAVTPIGRAIPALLVLVSAFLAGVPRAAAEPQRFNCVIDPSLSVSLGSPVTGLLEEVLVGRGDWIEAGQVVARLQSRIERATVTLLQARAESNAEIEGQQARVQLAEQQFARARTLYRRQIASSQQLDERSAALEVARLELVEAELAKRLAELELARAEEVERQRTIVSPVSGWVVERHLSAGEYVYQEAQIVSIARLDPLHVEAFVPVRWYPSFAVGMTGTVHPGGPIGEPHSAKVIVVDQVFDASSGTFGIRLALPNSDNALPAGQRCEVAFDLAPP